MPSSRATAAALLPFAILGIALAVLATLQYRWIGEVAEAERQRMRSSIDFAAHHFSDEFDRELTRAFVTFQLPMPDARPDVLAHRYDDWVASTRDTRLVRALWFVPAGETTHLVRFDPRTHQSAPAAWPASLLPVKARIEAQLAGGPPVPLIFDDATALVVPCGGIRHMVLPHNAPPTHEMMMVMMHGRMPACPAFTIVELDRSYLTATLLPELTRRYFDVDEGRYDVAVVDASQDDNVVVDHSKDDNVVYRSASPFDAAHADIALPIFRVLHLGDGMPPSEQAPRPTWQLLVRHHNGSLDATVDATRRHNLALTFAILLVLAGSGASLVMMLSRAERLRRQQLDFVAAVTHELNTPLAALTSAGQNLADGITREPSQVQRYGTMIVKESRRLGDMVAQVLEHAGMQARRARKAPASVDVARLIADALAQTRWLIDQEQVAVETSIDADLPPVVGDPHALERALQNLITNAVKYGGASKWVGLRASRDTRGRVSIAIEDAGPGIAADDARRLFEPFFRGRGADRVRGSGLGLTIVKQIVDAHGGTIAAGRSSRGGAAFTITLPSAAIATQAVEVQHA